MGDYWFPGSLDRQFRDPRISNNYRGLLAPATGLLSPTNRASWSAQSRAMKMVPSNRATT